MWYPKTYIRMKPVSNYLHLICNFSSKVYLMACILFLELPPETKYLSNISYSVNVMKYSSQSVYTERWGWSIRTRWRHHIHLGNKNNAAWFHHGSKSPMELSCLIGLGISNLSQWELTMILNLSIDRQLKLGKNNDWPKFDINIITSIFHVWRRRT